MADTEQEQVEKSTVTVTINGTAVEANPGELLIAAAERNGTYIPRFCWHNRMRSVGMCRSSSYASAARQVLAELASTR